ncbi:hypothetical protein [Mycetocola spongiae]|uniref:hypothetical protein n=1 Tax=Mycetocola spongiae TaxID=2859226 RepID=UPI001CF3AF4C|nr:hypothetical protein [Mycetocola spongiae]UCR89290.1 hypothetical protein KXZ72_00820 [Mycetocola spongiae]
MSKIALDLADKFKNTGVGTSYGAPVEVDGATMVPVAVGWFGFGAGDSGSAGEGNGGGGGSLSLPIGAYEKTREGWKFSPNIIALLTVSVPVICVLGRALSRIIRAAKK